MIVTEQPVRDVPQEREIRDELQRLVLADLHGPLGGDGEEFSGENPIDRYPLGRLAPRGVVLEPDTHDDLAAADAGDSSEVDPEPSAPNVPSLNPSALGFTAQVEGQAFGLRATAKWARYELTRPSARKRSAASSLKCLARRWYCQCSPRQTGRDQDLT